MQAQKKSLVRASLPPAQPLRFQIEIDNLPDFRQQLDSVKFPVKDAAKKFFDVVLCVTSMGVTLASQNAQLGNALTKTLIKKASFARFHFSSNGDNDREEFCLPFLELRHIVDTLVGREANSKLHLRYPVGDSKLEAAINEELRGQETGEPLKMTTRVLLDVFESS